LSDPFLFVKFNLEVVACDHTISWHASAHKPNRGGKHVGKESKSKSRLGKGRTKVAGHKGNGQEKNIGINTSPKREEAWNSDLMSKAHEGGTKSNACTYYAQ